MFQVLQYGDGPLLASLMSPFEMSTWGRGTLRVADKSANEAVVHVTPFGVFGVSMNPFGFAARLP